MTACPHCGKPMTEGGTATVCATPMLGENGGRTYQLRLPPYCADRDCRRARDEAAMARALASGLLAPADAAEEQKWL